MALQFFFVSEQHHDNIPIPFIFVYALHRSCRSPWHLYLWSIIFLHIFSICPVCLAHLPVSAYLLVYTSGDYSAGKLAFGWLQTLSFAVAFIYPVILLRNLDISRDAKFLDGGASFIVAGAFWSVMLIGIVDAAISFVRIEGFLPVLVGDDLALSLGKPAFRGTYVHIPLLAIGFGIAMLRKGIDFIWLASLIVFGDYIVITRFIFSYEQAFMGDLVRFWYASLFLFASAYTLIHDGHVRVDVIYAGRKKPKTEPICWALCCLACR